MKRLSKTQIKEKANFISALTEAKEKLDKAIEDYNSAIDREYMKVDAAIAAFNSEVGAFNEWRDGLHDEMQNFYDDRTDTWRDGDAGQSYSEWMDQWNAEWAEIDQAEPDKLEVDIGEDPENLDANYPDEAS